MCFTYWMCVWIWVLTFSWAFECTVFRELLWEVYTFPYIFVDLMWWFTVFFSSSSITWIFWSIISRLIGVRFGLMWFMHRTWTWDVGWGFTFFRVRFWVFCIWLWDRWVIHWFNGFWRRLFGWFIIFVRLWVPWFRWLVCCIRIWS